MKKCVKLTLRLVLTVGLSVVYVYVVHVLEYWSQLNAVDNITGAAPLILLTGIMVFLTVLIWKRHKNAETSTMVLVVMGVIWALLFIPALTGNWYPLATMPAPDLTSPDLSVYAPFSQDTQAARLPGGATLTIAEDFPVLDGATALYPMYAAFVNAVYDEASYSPDMALCSNTPNAYKRIIAGDCDIIFVASASEKQKQAAVAAGSELVFTPIGREAFVFLVGKENPVDGLSYQQLKNIYSGKTAYWHTFGWKDGGKIIAFQRPEGSGSQTGLQNIMRGLPIQRPQPLPDDSLIGTGSMMKQVSVEWKGVQPAIGYSYRYYATTMYANPDVKMLALDGVYPSNETIANESYPFANNFYAVTNGQPTGNVKRLIDWILTDEGQYLLEQTGYVPLKREPAESQATETITPSAVEQSQISFSTIDILKKYYNKNGDYIELDLKLPELEGDYNGISQINDFFVGKEKYFYDELGIDEWLKTLDEYTQEYPSVNKKEGMKDGWYRLAHYNLEAVFCNIISISANLDGGLGGVNWLGLEGNTFDMNTGKRLALSDIFKVSEEQYMNIIYDFVSREIADNINEALKSGHESVYWFDDAYSEKGYETIRQFNPNDFYLSEESLVVFYPKYTFSAGAAGLTLNIFEIPYDSILDVLAVDIEKP